MLASTLSVYIVVAIYSTVFAYRRLHRPGVSKEVREMFVKKHFLYVLVFILIWTIQQTQNYYELFNPAVAAQLSKNQNHHLASSAGADFDIPEVEGTIDRVKFELIQRVRNTLSTKHPLEQLGYQLGLRDHILAGVGLRARDIFGSTAISSFAEGGATKDDPKNED